MNKKIYLYAESVSKKNKLLKKIMLLGYNGIRYLNSFRPKLIKEVEGIKYELDLSEAIDSNIYYWNGFEHETIDLIDKYVKAGDVVIDVGANVGCHTLKFSKIAGNTGKIIAFEPMSWAQKKLIKNISLNKTFSKNIIVEKKALSDATLKHQKCSFRTSWKLFEKDVKHKDESVDFITLDDYVKQKKITKLDFMKIDVDGFECKVIKGAENTLRKFKPIIVMEIGKYTTKAAGDDVADLIDVLYKTNYTIIWEKDNYKFKNKKDVLKNIPENETINIICVSKNSAKK